MMQSILEVIQQSELFQGLTADQRYQLAEITERVEYPAGAAIIEQDTPGDTLYIIGEGQVEIQQSSGGVPETTIYLGDGQIFGEVALLDGGPRSATVIAADDPTVLYSIRRDRFEELCKTDTALGYQIMRNLALDLAFKLRHQNLNESEAQAEGGTPSANDQMEGAEE
jgi:CRP-like cAMP-binding protein